MNDNPTTTTVLVGLDGKPGAAQALEWVIHEYAGGSTVIVACSVLTPNKEFFNDITPAGMGQWRGQLHQDLAGPWTEPARAAGLDVRPVMVEADTVYDGLLATAEAEHARLIVVGLNGRGRITDRLLGANTYKLVHRASTPVVVVPPTER